MAQRRMFSPDIVESDAFLEMPSSTQSLYFHLGMRADDDGFVNPRATMRMAGATEDDLKILIAKRFVLPFENGVVVVKHWRMNNLVRKDWYRPTLYNEQKETLYIKENGAYTQDPEQGQPVVNESVTNRQRSIGKVSIEERKSGEPKGSHLFKAKFNPEEDKAPEKEPKDPRVKKITADFRARVKKEVGREPAWGLPMGWKCVKTALSKLSEGQMKEMMDIWFEASHEDNKAMRITQCFSAYEIDRYLNEI